MSQNAASGLVFGLLDRAEMKQSRAKEAKSGIFRPRGSGHATYSRSISVPLYTSTFSKTRSDCYNYYSCTYASLEWGFAYLKINRS